MKDLFNNPIAPKPAPKAKKAFRGASPPRKEHIGESNEMMPFRPYRIARLSTTQVWCINL